MISRTRFVYNAHDWTFHIKNCVNHVEIHDKLIICCPNCNIISFHYHSVLFYNFHWPNINILVVLFIPLRNGYIIHNWYNLEPAYNHMPYHLTPTYLIWMLSWFLGRSNINKCQMVFTFHMILISNVIHKFITLLIVLLKVKRRGWAKSYQ